MIITILTKYQPLPMTAKSRLPPTPDAGTLRGGEDERSAQQRGTTYLAKRFYQIMLGTLTEALEGSGLVSTHWGILRAIHLEPGIGQQRICERQSIDPNSASRFVDELEAMGLVRRDPVPGDRRAYALQVTDAGRELRRRLRPGVLAARDRVLAPLTQEERQVFVDLLTRVVQANAALARPGNGRRRPTRASERASTGSTAPKPANRSSVTRVRR